MNINYYFLIIPISIFKPIIIIRVLELITYESVNSSQQLICICQNNAKRY